MALKGSLKDFSLPDLFQLLNISKKSGTLNLVRGNARGYVCFRNGEVFFATTNWKRKPLGVKLMQAGIVTKAQVDEALELQRTTARGQRLGQLLIRLGYLTKEKLEQFVQEQIQDAIFELLRWTDGEFDFQPGVVFPEEDIGLSISTEELIMEGSRRLDEWNRIEKKIPDLNAVFRMKSMQDRSAAQISLTPEEWMVLTFVDGERTVRDIIELAGMGTLQTCKIIYGLISAGLLENVAPDAEERKVEQELERMAEELRQMEERVIERPGYIRREDLKPIGLEEEEEREDAGLPRIEEVAPPAVEEVPEEELAEEELAGVDEALAEVEAPLLEEEEAALSEEERPEVEETAPAATIAPVEEMEIAEAEEVEEAEIALPEEVAVSVEEVPVIEEVSPSTTMEELEIEPLEVEIGEDSEGEILIEEFLPEGPEVAVVEAEETPEETEPAVVVLEVGEPEAAVIETLEAGEQEPEAPEVTVAEVKAPEVAAEEEAQEPTPMAEVQAPSGLEEAAEEEAVAEELPELEELVAEAAERVVEDKSTRAMISDRGAGPLELIAGLPAGGEALEEELSPEEMVASLEAEMLVDAAEEAPTAPVEAEIEALPAEPEAGVVLEEEAASLEAEMLVDFLEEEPGPEVAGAAVAEAKEAEVDAAAEAVQGPSPAIEAQAPSGPAAVVEKAEGEELVEELKSRTLEESEEAVQEIRLDEREEELEALKEKIMSLLPEGVEISGEPTAPAGEKAVEEEERPPQFMQESMTKESIEAQAAKRAYLEKRYGKVGRLADREQIAELEPEQIPLEWSGHLARISHAREEPTIPPSLVERATAETGEKAPERPAGRGIDPTKILGAAFRSGELRDEERATLGIDEHVVDLTSLREGAGPTAVIEPPAPGPVEAVEAAEVAGPELDLLAEVEELVEEVPPEPALSGPVAGEDVAAPSPASPLDLLSTVEPSVEEALDPVAALEAEMLVEASPGDLDSLSTAAPVKEAVDIITEVPVPQAETEAPRPAVDQTFLRIEELELDMLEDVVEEPRVTVEEGRPAETAPQPSPEEVPEMLEPVSVEAGVTTASRPIGPVGVEELEADMLEDFTPQFEATPQVAPEAAGASAGELDLEAAELEAEVFGQEEAALEEDILTDIEAIEKELEVEEEGSVAPASELDVLEKIIEAPTPAAPEPAAPPAPEPAPASELDVLEKIIEAPTPAAPEPAAPPAAVQRTREAAREEMGAGAAAVATPPPEAPAPPAPSPAAEGTAKAVVEEKGRGPAAEAAPPPPAEDIFDGSFALERELAELTGAGAPAATKKIKIPVKQAKQAKEGEKPMQQEGKPVPKVKRDKTVTKGIVMRIIDGIKRL